MATNPQTKPVDLGCESALKCVVYCEARETECVYLVQLNLINCDDYVVSVVILAQMQPNVQLVSYCI